VFTARYGLGIYIQFYVLPTHCIYMFSVDLKTNSDYFPTQHKGLVCITETECVYCAVRTESFYIYTFCPHGAFICFCMNLRTNSDYFPIQQ